MGRMNTRRMWWTLRLALGVFCVAGADDCASAQAPGALPAMHSPLPMRAGELPADIEEALWWLPKDTETILMSRGNVPLTELRQGKPAEDMDGGPYLPSPPGHLYPKQAYPPEDLVAMYCIEPLVYYRRVYPPDVRQRMINHIYSAQSATLFMKALCWEGDGTRQTCDIVLFADNGGCRLVEALAAMPSIARTTEGVKIVEVNLNEEPPGMPGNRARGAHVREEPDRRWLAAPRPNVYLCATSLELLKLVIARMSQRSSPRAMPAALPEWQYVNPAWSAWGVRHYRRATADNSTLSMLKWDPEALGLVFFGGSDPEPYFALRYLSN